MRSVICWTSSVARWRTPALLLKLVPSVCSRAAPMKPTEVTMTAISASMSA